MQLSLDYAFGPRHVVLFSGGHSSARVAVEVVRRYGRDGTVLLNHDIHPRAEDADVKRFKQEVADHLRLPITYANHDEWDAMDQFDVVRKARAFKVRNGQELCTSRLKTEPFSRWLKANAPPGSCTLYYGFDANENHRIQRRASILGAQGYATAFPLAHWPVTIESTREIGIEPPLTYGRFKHANCKGCLKAGWQHWFIVYAFHPDIWQLGKDAEEDIGHTIHRDGSLESREPQFAAMLAAGVDPTEWTPSGEFWADARKRVRSLPVVPVDFVADAVDTRPCECVFVRPKAKHAPPTRAACDCGVAPGELHRLWCVRVGMAA